MLVNQELVIYKPVILQDTTQHTLLASAATTSSEENPEEITPTQTPVKHVASVKKATPAAPIRKAKMIIHSVQPGDTLWNISQKYKGISIETIKKKNKLKSDDLKPGQKLVIS